MIETGKIYCEDCSETMKRMDDNSVDIILTSPPYRRKSTEIPLAEVFRSDDYSENDSPRDHAEWITNLFVNDFDRILSKDGVILWNQSYAASRHGEEYQPDMLLKTLASIVENTPFSVADRIVWKKTMVTPNNMSKNLLTRVCEDFYVFVRKSELKTFNANKKVVSVRKTGQKNYENIPNFVVAKVSDQVCPYKATFSSDLVMKLLRIYVSRDGMLVYDPFIGTGSTAIGCMRFGHGISWIGSEISEEQWNWANDRISNYSPEQFLSKSEKDNAIEDRPIRNFMDLFFEVSHESEQI